ncbi:vegetative cell wall protein gp1-like [Mustela erminea]|uniref:vegetative cell wall protein gp1-like n=1 Tax=Mustela erminea TaxID=36723 RepID=UPI001386F26C|nr:vegetative cell wall protein gp1-like [Mustela erminea]
MGPSGSLKQGRGSTNRIKVAVPGWRERRRAVAGAEGGSTRRSRRSGGAVTALVRARTAASGPATSGPCVRSLQPPAASSACSPASGGPASGGPKPLPAASSRLQSCLRQPRAAACSFQPPAALPLAVPPPAAPSRRLQPPASSRLQLRAACSFEPPVVPPPAAPSHLQPSAICSFQWPRATGGPAFSSLELPRHQQSSSQRSRDPSSPRSAVLTSAAPGCQRSRDASNPEMPTAPSRQQLRCKMPCHPEP